MQEISLRTDRRTQLVDITVQVQEALGPPNGAAAALVYVPHTTAAVTINEGAAPSLGVALAPTGTRTASPAGTKPKPAAGIHKIKHVIVIMQENRSFDHYFGTYPGADGLPRTASGEFAVCAPNPATGGCEKPF